MLYTNTSTRECDPKTFILAMITAGALWLTLGALVFTNQLGADPAKPVNETGSPSSVPTNKDTGIAFMVMGGLCLLPFAVLGSIFAVAVLLEKFKNKPGLISDETPLIISTGENHMSRSNLPNLFQVVSDVAVKRIETIEKQRLYEEEMQLGGAAVFLTPDMLTPLFIDPATVVFDDQSSLFKLKQNSVLPEGLISDEKANDPAQLSTVLGRTLSMRKMLDQGVSILVMTLNENRKQVSDTEKMVDDQEIKKIQSRYPHFQHHVITMEEGLLKKYETICPATYCYANGVTAGVIASQIHKADIPATDCVLQPNVDLLQGFLESKGIHFVLPVATQQCEYTPV